MKGRIITSFAILAATLAGAVAASLPAAPDANATTNTAPYEARYRAVSQQVDVDALGTRVANLETFVDGAVNRINEQEKRIYALELLAYLTPTLTPVPPTATPQATSAPSTATPAPSATPRPTNAPTATPTQPPHIGQGFDCTLPAAQRMYVCAGDVQLPPALVPNLAGQTCPQWVHDQHLVAVTMNVDGSLRTMRTAAASLGNGVAWRTWHPAIDPATGCGFDHEHGDDPRTSNADKSAPAFGYESNLAGMVEPHFGFKVAIANAGDINPFDGNRQMLANGRLVFHMGTSGIGRLTERMHSFSKVLRDANGTLLVDVRGIADTGNMGNICQRDAAAQQNNNTDDDIGRTLGQPGASCAKDQSYEIWAGKFSVRTGAQSWDYSEVNFQMAQFDPVTVLTVDGRGIRPNPAGGGGCIRESYFGSVFLRSTGGAYMTDIYGDAVTPADPKAVRQYFARGQGPIRLNSDNGIPSVYKSAETDYCTPFLTLN
jgi:hypothetical protein